MIEAYLIIAIVMAAVIVGRENRRNQKMSELSILTALVKGGMTPKAACAMGGNMMAESGMKSNIAQRGMTKLTDEQYTQSADAGTINFADDGVGYGLCQWTYKTRKKHLLEYAKSMGESVGDEFTQVQFCFAELKNDFPTLWSYLQTTKNLNEATARICTEYERPAVNNVHARRNYAQQMYNDYGPILEEIAVKGSSTMHPDPVGEPGESGDPGIPSDAEPPSYIMGTVRNGDHTPEACFLMAQLKKVGYDVLWLGMDACLRDFQQKKGLEADGICGEKTWREILK